MNSTTTSTESETFNLFTISEWARLVEQAQFNPYKKFCEAHKVTLPEDWAMIFHTDFTHDVPDIGKGRIFFSRNMTDGHNNPLIAVIDKKKQYSIATFGLKEYKIARNTF